VEKTTLKLAPLRRKPHKGDPSHRGYLRMPKQASRFIPLDIIEPTTWNNKTYFLILSHAFSHFLIVSHTFLCSLILSYAFSYFLMLSHTFSYFLILFHPFSYLLILSHTVLYLISFLHTFSIFGTFCFFKVISLVWAYQGKYFVNATACSKRTLKM